MILMYHKIDLDSPTIWWVTVNNFIRQMLELQSYKIVYLDDYNPEDLKQVVITFDGVYKNVLKFAAPQLKRLGYPFELFISNDYIGKDNSFDINEPLCEFTSIQELKELTRYGARLQWHGKTHQSLKNISDIEIIRTELEVPRQVREIDPNGFKWFAFPHGECHNDILLAEVKQRFKGAVSCHQGDNSIYQLNRETVTNQTSFRKHFLSLIIVSYNYGDFLAEAVESVLRQTQLPNEVIIMDDCSLDNTAEIAEYYALKYPNYIRFYRNVENLGIVKTFNKAVGLAKGECICFLGADNRISSTYVEDCIKILDNDESVGIVYTDFALFGNRAKIVYEQFPPSWRGEIKENYFFNIRFPEFDDCSKEELKKRNFIHGSSMYRRKAFEEVGGYEENRIQAEDRQLFFKIIQKGWLAQKAKKCFLEYRQHSVEQINQRMISIRELNTYKLMIGSYRSFIKKLFNILIHFLQNKKIIIFGTGSLSEKLSLNCNFAEIAYYIDNNKKKWGTHFMGVEVKDPRNLLTENKEDIVIIVASQYFKDISLQLNTFGFVENIHYIDGSILGDIDFNLI